MVLPMELGSGGWIGRNGGGSSVVVVVLESMTVPVWTDQTAVVAIHSVQSQRTILEYLFPTL